MNFSDFTFLRKFAKKDDDVVSQSKSLTLTLIIPFFVVYFIALFWRFHTPTDIYLTYFTDDFYYYVQVAKHLACCATSSFNGVQPTNGYHPLWTLALTALWAVAGDGTPKFFIAATLLIFLLTLGAFIQIRRLQSALSPGSSWNFATALFSLTFIAALTRTGMEIGLVLFFLIWFWRRMAVSPLEQQNAGQAMLSGLLASLVILSRIDALIAIGSYGLLSLLGPSRRAVLRNAAPFAVGLAPVLIYVAINKIAFDTILPISGMAKNLKETLLPSATTIARLLTPDGVNLLFTWPSIALAVIFIARWTRSASWAGDRVRLAAIAHPVLFYLALSLSSDWPLWTWYLYPLAPLAALLGPAVFERMGQTRLPAPGAAANAVVALCLALVVASLGRLNPGAMTIYQAAKQLQAFAKDHPGRYAMGDRAGTPAYLMGEPIIQTEGLMGDRPFLERIKRKQNLLEALKDLDVDYYVATSPRREDGCFVASEPAQAGPHSPKMTGRLCGPPVARFENSGFETLVFAIKAKS